MRFKKAKSFLSLVKLTGSVLSELAHKPTSSHHVSMVWRALCMSPHTVIGNFPQYTSLWATPGYHISHSRTIESCCCQTTLLGSSNPPDNGVANPVSDKSSINGVIGGVNKSPFYT